MRIDLNGEHVRLLRDTATLASGRYEDEVISMPIRGATRAATVRHQFRD
jgi:hypothetical protein